jgi:ribose transport system permease protein
LRLRTLGTRVAIWLALLVLLILGGLLSPVFLRPANLLNIVSQASVVGIAAIGVTFVMITGGIDLSVAGLITLTAVLGAAIMNGEDARIPLAVAIALGVGLGVGLTNGILVARLGVDSFILTLAMTIALLGITQLYTGGSASGAPAPGFVSALRAHHASIPMLATLFSLIAVVGLFVQRRTSFGRRLYLVGANPRAAYLSGIAVRGTLIGAYAVSGVVAALAGLALLARAGLPTDFTGMGLHFQALAAVVLGGTTFEGGRGGVEGTIAGVLILAVSFALVTIMGLSLGVQLLVRGGVICAAGALYALLQRKGGQ